MEISVSSVGGSIVVRSTDVAAVFGKRHNHVLRDIDTILRMASAHNPSMDSELFRETTFTNSRSRKYREFLMNRDGFALLAMGFLGEKAFAWKLKYIEAFNKMEKSLLSSEKGLMVALSEAVYALESDMEKASQYGKALSDWKRIKQQHIEAIIEANSKTQMLINFG